MHKVVIFDLDGTLAESKQPIAPAIAARLSELLIHTRIGVISGGALPQFLKQVVAQLPSDANLSNLYLLPTSGAALYKWEHPSTPLRAGDEWKNVYEEHLKDSEVAKIEEAMREAAAETGLIDFSKPAYGPYIERRGGEVSLSALGQRAPIALKKEWDPDKKKRHALQAAIQKRLPEFAAGMGGATTIDVTKRGVDKAYGLRQLCRLLNVSEKDALYIGDELEKDGNDEAVFKTAAAPRAVASPAETAALIEELLRT